MTANAVCSLSLEPLQLLVCVERSAHCHAQLLAARAFAVNVLAADQRVLSELFARTQPPEQGTLRGASHRLSARAIPLLDGAHAHLECRVAEIYAGGDHDIFLGEVLDGAAPNDGSPLLFYRGRYRSLG
jgi:flavin reductase (DIM6/NTAB) family NADH-FMN oxidoreductase RutF